MTNPHYGAPLAKHAAAMNDPDPMGAYRFCKAKWHDDNVLVVMIDMPGLSASDRATAIGFAEMLFGERR